MGLMWNSNAKINTFIKLHTWLVVQPPQIVFVNYVVMNISHSLDCPTLS